MRAATRTTPTERAALYEVRDGIGLITSNRPASRHVHSICS
jgi:hypothetical protein